jgi:hypothetical protein
MAIIERRVPQRSGEASIYPSLSRINCKKVIDILLSQADRIQPASIATIHKILSSSAPSRDMVLSWITFAFIWHAEL